MTQLTARTSISDTYPLPSNATAKLGLAALYDVLNEFSQAAELDLASAATTDIGAQLSRKLRITGATGPITSFGTTYTGPIMLRFSGAPTITHHATTLICPGGANLTLAAGDIIIAYPKCTVSGTFDGWAIYARPNSQLAALAGNASQAFSALAVNTAKTTVASSATPDIFAVTTGQLIDYTGTATATGFTAAPQAGMFRELYCADACLFTAGANLLIEGIPSGTTITLAAGALVHVRSITTTQFKMTYSVSGTFTATGTGFTVNPTVIATYSILNGIAKINLASTGINGGLFGTSNATSFTITGLPACLAPVTYKTTNLLFAQDSSSSIYTTVGIITAGSQIITLSASNYSSANWTASGSKSLHTTEIIYSLN